MSWITEIAGKAENFLNKIDQNAAVALNSQHVDSDSRSRSRPKTSTALAVPSHDWKNGESDEGQYSNSNSSSKSSSRERYATATSTNGQNGDGNIIYASSAKASASALALGPPKAKPPRKTHPMQSSDPTTAIVLGTIGNGHLQKSSITATAANAATTDQELLDFLNCPEQKEIDMNSYLKTELDAQQREMSQLLRNNKKLQLDYETLKKSLESNPISSSKNQNLPRQPDTEAKKFLEEQVSVKDAEIQRLTERLDQALGKLQQSGELGQTQNQIQLLERENRQLKAQCEDLSKNLESSAAAAEIGEKQVKTTKETLAGLEKEFAAYKDKAKLILKTKDELIASIKAQAQNTNWTESQGEEGEGIPATASVSATEGQFLSEIGALRNERELLHAEITQSRVYMESLREESNRIEEELQTLRSSNANLHKLLSKEKQKGDSMREENFQLSQEISSLQLLLERERIEGKKTQEKWEKFCDQNSNSFLGSNGGGLTTMTMTKSSSVGDFSGSPGPGLIRLPGYSDMDETENLRTRITALSQSLLEKQNLINGLSSDKQVLQIRCERLAAQVEGMTNSTDSLGNEGNFTHSVVSSQPLYLSESPWDSRMATRVKRVYSRVDSFCCEIGLVLRQRPNLRLGFCVYILFLHLWVFLVLFTWAHHTSVSGHNEDDKPKPLK